MIYFQMKMKKILLVGLLGFLAPQLHAQKIFWASKVLNFSSQYNTKEYSAQQILGPPNGIPYYERSFVAWTPASQSNQASITVEFPQATQVQQIAIGENLMSGAIEKIFLYDEKGKEYVVYSNPNTQSSRPQANSFFHHFIPLTTYKVNRLKLQLKYTQFKELPQIDCIAISPDAKKIEPQINTIQNSTAIPLPENLGNGVNSQYHDMLPIISPDGKTLYFARKNSPENLGTARKDDIYISQRQATGSWSRAVNIGTPLNTEEHNFVCAISPDGNTMYLANKYDYRTEAQGVAVSYRQKNGSWSKPTPLNIANMYNKHKYAGYHLSIDEKVLVMAIERDDTYGDMDLYVSFRYADGNWTEPMNIGSDLNTAGAEASVFLAADGRTLYFSSNGHAGYGDLDMFMSKRLDNTWKNWSTPVNLGSKINTVGMDIYYTIPASGEYAYYSSERGGYGLNDIYRITLPKELRPDAVRLDPGLYVSKETDIPKLRPYQTANPSDLDKRIEELKKQLNRPSSSTNEQKEVAQIQEKEKQLDQEIKQLEQQYQTNPAPIPATPAPLPSYTPTAYYDASYDEKINDLKRQLEKVKLEQPAVATNVSTKTQEKSLSTYEQKLAQIQNQNTTSAVASTAPKKELSAYEEKLKQLQSTQNQPAPVPQKPVRLNGSNPSTPNNTTTNDFFTDEVLPDKKSTQPEYTPIVTTPTATTKSTTPNPYEEKLKQLQAQNNSATSTATAPTRISSEPTLTENAPKENTVVIPELPSTSKLTQQAPVDTEEIKRRDAERQALEDSILALQKQKDMIAQNNLQQQKTTQELQEKQQNLLSEQEKMALAIEQMKLEREQLALEKERLENERKKLEALKNQQYKDINSLKKELDSLQTLQANNTTQKIVAELSIDDELNKMKKQVGEKIALKNVYFVVNATFIQEKSYKDLDRLALYLIKNKELYIEIGGHTNGLCDDAFCIELSNKRAKSVMDYLISKGVPNNRLSYKGYGKSQNIADNSTEQGRKLNQRVEVMITKIQ